MSDRYEAVAVRKYQQNGEEKTAFTNIGVAFKMRDRDGFSLRLHCLPAPVDGEYSILLFPPKPRDDDRSAPRQASRSAPRAAHAPAFQSGGMDDDIPFAPEFR